MESHQILTPFQHKHLTKSLETEHRPQYRRRIEIMLLADAGYSQTRICETLGCSHETARYWITMAQNGQASAWGDRPMGRPRIVNESYRQRLRTLIHTDPRDLGYGFRRWTARWLMIHLEKEFGFKISSRYINYLLKDMGLSTRSPEFARDPKRAIAPPDSKTQVDRPLLRETG